VLVELHIRDLAIIDELQLSLDPSFTVLTGETGAGKSIIVDAVGLVLGGRADSTIVRAGADRALVEAVFRLGPRQRLLLDPLLEKEGLEGDDADLLQVGREVRVNGRNVCRVNGRTASLALLRQATGGAIDIHGQSEHLSLLRAREQLGLLDRYAELGPLLDETAGLVAQVREVRQELSRLMLHDQELAHRADLLRFQIGEIGAAALQPGEEEELLAERLRLANAEQLRGFAEEVLRVLGDADGDAPAVPDLLGVAVRALEGLSRVDRTVEAELRLAEGLSYQVEELHSRVREYHDQIERNPHRLQTVEDRIALIRRLERKYGQTISDVLTYADDASRELDAIHNSEERIAHLQSEQARLLAELGSLAEAVSERRRDAAQRLAVEIEGQLGDLGMAGAQFGVSFSWKPDPEGVPLANPIRALAFRVSVSGVEPLAAREYDPGTAIRVAFGASGIDQIAFLVSPNPGEPLRPMSKIASGGETSRLMLALKTVLSRADETPTLVFDEIDQGIGGRVGATVGEKLWNLVGASEPQVVRRQVLCVTHLPQLAGFGDVHLSVEKVASGDRMVTRVRRLEGRARVEEIAQMLGASGNAGFRSAEHILAQAARRKGQQAAAATHGA
jgi:DNA repair protein RecN (Recombination protein N)